MKRFLDLTFSFSLFVLFFPILIATTVSIWLSDFKNPFYIALRIGKNGREFKMIKFRTMIVNADKTGVDSTGNNDTRITKIGAFIRKFKLDELPQLINVIRGEMSMVGPRPNVKRETDLYTSVEKKILSVAPGITDISSLVFADEGDILAPYNDPDIAYNQLIRPRKSLLAIFYIQNRTNFLDIELMFLTFLRIFSKQKSKALLIRSIRSINNDEQIISIIRRDQKLTPIPPPGSKTIVLER